jgi:NAD(P)-dependent dehydrogenase (short-subunit alcohol dehydrogenase family)
MVENPNKVAFITGGNRGIGLETARVLATQGIDVVIGSRDAEKGEAAASALFSQGLAVTTVRCDVTSSTDHQAVFQYFQRKYGRLDILINNAGVRIPESDSTAEVSMSALHKTFETNFFAQVALTQKLLPLIRLSPAGRIVNLSSILGSLNLHSTPGSPIYDFKSFAYDASKTALNAFTIHLAYELRDTSIKVNSAHPGWVKTEMGGVNAPMEIVDGAKTSVQLATLSADGPTGGYFFLGERLPW